MEERSPRADDAAIAEETRARNLEQEGKLEEALAAYQSASSRYRVVAEDRAAIAALMERFRQAMERKSIDDLRAIWPNMGARQERQLREYFKILRQLSVSLSCEIELRGEGAVASCDGTDQVEFENGDTQTVKAQTVFTLRKANGNWLIERSEGAGR